MLRGMTWLGKTVAAGLIISFLSIWTTGYIVNSYVESLLKQYNIPLEMKPAAVSGVWGKLWGADGDKGSSDSGNAGTAVNGDAGGAAAGSGADGGGEEGNGSDNGAADGSAGSGEAIGSTDQDGAGDSGGASGVHTPVDGTAQNGQQGLAPLTGAGGGGGSQAASGNNGGTTGGGAVGSVGGDNGLDGREVAVTIDDITGLKEEMSGEDKDELFTLLTDKLPQESWQLLSELMENGLTDQELITVQQIIAQHLDKEEYESMMAILKKY